MMMMRKQKKSLIHLHTMEIIMGQNCEDNANIGDLSWVLMKHWLVLHENDSSRKGFSRLHFDGMQNL